MPVAADGIVQMRTLRHFTHQWQPIIGKSHRSRPAMLDRYTCKLGKMILEIGLQRLLDTRGDEILKPGLLLNK